MARDYPAGGDWPAVDPATGEIRPVPDDDGPGDEEPAA
jgi:hypothetical protein